MMETLAMTMFHGLIIGVLISAPMGPIGALCIQRTLNKGRWAGFFTGVGASLSDFIYCLLTGLGMSFIIDFIESNQSILQVLGSFVLIVFGIYLFMKTPVPPRFKPITTEQKFKFAYTQDFVTGFFLTFSNPLILFLIIGLFAQFGFMQHNLSIYESIAGFLCIIIGALIWWFLITFFVNAVRGHFNPRTIWFVNRTIATIIIVMAAVGMTLGLSEIFKF